jgi:hypothetical protein
MYVRLSSSHQKPQNCTCSARLGQKARTRLLDSGDDIDPTSHHLPCIGNQSSRPSTSLSPSFRRESHPRTQDGQDNSNRLIVQIRHLLSTLSLPLPLRPLQMIQTWSICASDPADPHAALWIIIMGRIWITKSALIRLQFSLFSRHRLHLKSRCYRVHARLLMISLGCSGQRSDGTSCHDNGSESAISVTEVLSKP